LRSDRTLPARPAGDDPVRLRQPGVVVQGPRLRKHRRVPRLEEVVLLLTEPGADPGPDPDSPKVPHLVPAVLAEVERFGGFFVAVRTLDHGVPSAFAQLPKRSLSL